MAAYTGGDLNILNGKYGISAPYKSVPIMKLIKAHRPKSKEELYDKAMCEMQSPMRGFKIEKTEGFMDEELRIDLIVSKDDKIICYIQVKPYLFTMVREIVIKYNRSAIQRWDKHVHYLYYDQNEKFINLKEIIDKINLQ